LKTIIAKISETAYKRLSKLKEAKGFKNRDWGEFFDFLSRSIYAEDTVIDQIAKTTLEKLLPLWCENFAENLPHIRGGNAINDLEGKNKGEAAIVIGAGPSLKRHEHLRVLAESDFDGVVLVCDKVLIECLKAGVTPDRFEHYYCGSVDGNRELIWKNYDHSIVDAYGKQIKGIFATTVAPNTRERAEKAGISIYWFNPIYDDWRRNESLTRLQGMMTKTEKRPKGIGAVRAGGNVGSCLWSVAFSVLGCKRVCLIGMDTGYLDGTPIEKTAYYQQLMRSCNNDVTKVVKYFKRIYNPHFKCYCLVDHVFDSYRKIWQDLSKKVPSDVLTINCTEGGSLFGGGIYCMKFKDFLANYKNKDILKFAL